MKILASNFRLIAVRRHIGREFVRLPGPRSPLARSNLATAWLHRSAAPAPTCCARERVWGVSKSIAGAVRGADHFHLRRRCRSERSPRASPCLLLRKPTCRCISGAEPSKRRAGCGRRAAAADLAVAAHLCRRLPPAQVTPVFNRAGFLIVTRVVMAPKDEATVRRTYPSDGWPSSSMPWRMPKWNRLRTSSVVGRRLCFYRDSRRRADCRNARARSSKLLADEPPANATESYKSADREQQCHGGARHFLPEPAFEESLHGEQGGGQDLDGLDEEIEILTVSRRPGLKRRRRLTLGFVRRFSLLRYLSTITDRPPDPCGDHRGRCGDGAGLAWRRAMAAAQGSLQHGQDQAAAPSFVPLPPAVESRAEAYWLKRFADGQ